MPAATDKGEKLFTVKGAAACLGVDESTIRRWLANDRLPYIQHEVGGVIFIRVSDLFAAKRASERG